MNEDVFDPYDLSIYSKPKSQQDSQPSQDAENDIENELSQKEDLNNINDEEIKLKQKKNQKGKRQKKIFPKK